MPKGKVFKGYVQCERKKNFRENFNFEIQNSTLGCSLSSADFSLTFERHGKHFRATINDEFDLSDMKFNLDRDEHSTERFHTPSCKCNEDEELLKSSYIPIIDNSLPLSEFDDDSRIVWYLKIRYSKNNTETTIERNRLDEEKAERIVLQKFKGYYDKCIKYIYAKQK